jgi:uncharacterized membrane protein YsdA (DUF1294 family)
MNIILLYFLVINLAAFAFAGYDKRLAVKHKWRISENTLFALAAFGGCIGLLLAMLIFRHKISKPSFVIKFSAIVFIQILMLILKFVYNYNIVDAVWFLVS